jgi:hypothetical protein
MNILYTRNPSANIFEVGSWLFNETVLTAQALAENEWVDDDGL